VGDEGAEPGTGPALAERGRLVLRHAGTGPTPRVGDEDLRGVGTPKSAFLDGAGDPAGAATDVRPDPHTMYNVIVSPYETVTPTPGFWL
jgi:hypothetical protein